MGPVPTIAMRCTGFGEFMTVTPSIRLAVSARARRVHVFRRRPGAFVGVLAVQQAVRVLVLPLERLGVIEGLCFSQDLLDPRQCERRVAGDALSKILRRL